MMPFQLGVPVALGWRGSVSPAGVQVGSYEEENGFDLGRPIALKSVLGQVPEPAPGEPRPMAGAGVQVLDGATRTPIAGARVTVIGRGGILGITKTTGANGKALFGEAEIPEDVVAYRVEADEYRVQEKPFVPRVVVAFNLERPGFLGIPTWGWVAGGAAAVGLVVWASTGR